MSADTFVITTWAPQGGGGAGRDQGYCSTSCNAQDRRHKKERPGPKCEEPRLRNPGLNIWQVCKTLVLAAHVGKCLLPGWPSCSPHRTHWLTQCSKDEPLTDQGEGPMRYEPCLTEAEGRGEAKGSSWAGGQTLCTVPPRDVEMRWARGPRSRSLMSPGSHVLLLDPRES